MTFLFIAAAALAIAGAVMVCVAKNPVHNVLALVTNFLGLALLYLTLHAEFLAVIQIIIYAGAVMVLFLFVIALLTAGTKPVENAKETLPYQAAAAVAVGFILVALLGVRAVPARVPVPAVFANFGSVAEFGKQLLTTNLFAFELTAFVLMVAVVGVVILVGRSDARR